MAIKKRRSQVVTDWKSDVSALGSGYRSQIERAKTSLQTETDEAKRAVLLSDVARAQRLLSIVERPQ